MKGLSTCPKCGGDMYVIDSRPIEEGIYRRRKCIICDYRFTSVEIALQGAEAQDRKNIDRMIEFLNLLKKA